MNLPITIGRGGEGDIKTKKDYIVQSGNLSGGTEKRAYMKNRLNLSVWTAFFITPLLLFHIGKAEAKEVDWECINPEFADASYVNDKNECFECHEDYMRLFEETKHGIRFKTGARNELESRYCEACHGPMSKHLTASRKKEYRISLKIDSPLTPGQRNSICLQCHEKSLRTHWQVSPDEMAGVGCNFCHYVSERRPKKKNPLYDRRL